MDQATRVTQVIRLEIAHADSVPPIAAVVLALSTGCRGGLLQQGAGEKSGATAIEPGGTHGIFH
jgi:hypothetical protein